MLPELCVQILKNELAQLLCSVVNSVEVFIAGASGHQGKTKITICGYSIVFWATHHAKRSPFGLQLGFRMCTSVDVATKG